MVFNKVVLKPLNGLSFLNIQIQFYTRWRDRKNKFFFFLQNIKKRTFRLVVWNIPLDSGGCVRSSKEPSLSCPLNSGCLVNWLSLSHLWIYRNSEGKGEQEKSMRVRKGKSAEVMEWFSSACGCALALAFMSFCSF